MAMAQAKLAAPAALRSLRAAESWVALQVHPDPCNLGAEPDRIVALVRPALGAGPFSVVVELPPGSDGFATYLAVGARARIQADLLAVGDLWVRLDGARAWQPRPPWEMLRAAGGPARWLDRLAGLLQAQAPPASLADGLEAMLAGRQLPNANQHELRVETLRAAVEAGSELARALAKADAGAAGRAADRLAGLGTGLTPAGDDFLVGSMLALWSAADPSWARQACRAMLQAAGDKTNRMSRAWLRAAADGEAAEAWHALVRAMVSGESAAVRQATERLLRQGHTSGADALTGYLVMLGKTAPGAGAV